MLLGEPGGKHPSRRHLSLFKVELRDLCRTRSLSQFRLTPTRQRPYLSLGNGGTCVNTWHHCMPSARQLKCSRPEHGIYLLPIVQGQAATAIVPPELLAPRDLLGASPQ